MYKLQCVGHIQKRVGGRLRKLKSADKAPLSDGKSLSGKGRLTEKMINKLQNYFGIAVKKSNCNGTDKCNGTSLYKEKSGIPSVIRDKIRQIRSILLDLRDENH